MQIYAGEATVEWGKQGAYSLTLKAGQVVKFHKGLTLTWYVKTPIKKYYSFWHVGGVEQWEWKNCGELKFWNVAEKDWTPCNMDCSTEYWAFMTLSGEQAVVECNKCHRKYLDKYDSTKWAHYVNGQTDYVQHELPAATPGSFAEQEPWTTKINGTGPKMCHRCVLCFFPLPLPLPFSP